MRRGRLRLRHKLIYSIALIALLYLAAVFFPEALFSRKVQQGSFTVYYHAGLKDTTGLKAVLSRSIKLLQKSPFYDKTAEQKVFICRGYGEFTFFNPFASTAFAVNYPVTQNIFVAKANIATDSIYRNGRENNRRTLSGVLAHETVHSLLEQHLGYIGYKTLPVWKNEGYCDYIANESSFDEKQGMELLCKGNAALSPSAQYFLYRMYVTHLIDSNGVTHQGLFSNNYHIGKVRNAFIASKCR